VAWDQFYRVCDPLIRRFAVTCRVPKADLNDCLQEVWIELVRALPDFRYDPGRGLFRSWLYSLVHSKATDLIRRRARRPTANLDRAAGAPLFERDADPAAECERKGLQETVQHMLARLRQQVSARSYLALYMGSIEGRTAVEVAAALGLTPGQVRLRQHRMRQKLRVLCGCAAGEG
jgi:RNA polymerase sigma-70 factor (ECF subfamily)